MTPKLHRRIDKLEKKHKPALENTFTLEQICRMMWRQDREGFREFARTITLPIRAFIPAFERADADFERAANAR
jgi:hypothetical protein